MATDPDEDPLPGPPAVAEPPPETPGEPAPEDDDDDGLLKPKDDPPDDDPEDPGDGEPETPGEGGGVYGGGSGGGLYPPPEQPCGTTTRKEPGAGLAKIVENASFVVSLAAGTMATENTPGCFGFSCHREMRQVTVPVLEL